jgi:hypothetical protein
MPIGDIGDVMPAYNSAAMLASMTTFSSAPLVRMRWCESSAIIAMAQTGAYHDAHPCDNCERINTLPLTKNAPPMKSDAPRSAEIV